jgi:hypothetical protein
MLYNLINHPNLMGAHRSCGQSEQPLLNVNSLCLAQHQQV